jgi:hypothetical protein
VWGALVNIAVCTTAISSPHGAAAEPAHRLREREANVAIVEYDQVIGKTIPAHKSGTFLWFRFLCGRDKRRANRILLYAYIANRTAHALEIAAAVRSFDAALAAIRSGARRLLDELRKPS